MIFKSERDGWRARAQRKTLNQFKKPFFRTAKEASDQDPDRPCRTTNNTNENDLYSKVVKSKGAAVLFLHGSIFYRLLSTKRMKKL